MFVPRLLMFFIFLNSIKNSACFLTNTKNDVIESLNKELNIKHLSIIKDLNFRIDREILLFVKRLSQEKVYASLLSIHEMHYSIYENNYIPVEYYYSENQEFRKLIDRERANKVHPPKTMVILYGKNLKGFTRIIFQTFNEALVTKYTWLVADHFNESNFDFEDYYIPYNSQLLLLKDKQNGYLLEEFYHPSITHSSCFNRHFGIWEKSKGLEISEPDIYKRRSDMNGTVIGAFYGKGEENYLQGCNKIPRTECQLLRELSRILNFKWTVAETNPSFRRTEEIVLTFHIMDSIDFSPFFIGPNDIEAIYLLIAYDEKYIRHSISRLLSPFSFELWLAITTWIGISMVLIIVIQYFYKKTNEIKSFPPFWDYLYEPLESFFNQCGQEPPNKIPYVILTLATRLAALFMVPAYTGAILSFILIPIVTLPFKDLKGFVDDGSYRLGYLSEYLSLEPYQENSYDLSLKVAFGKFSEPITGSQYGEALQYGIDKMCEDHKFALFYYGITLLGRDCKLLRIPSPFVAGWSVLPLRYRSPYMKTFNRIFNNLKSSGVRTRMKRDLELGWKEATDIKSWEMLDEDIEATLHSLESIFITVGVLYGASVIILIFEIIVNKIRQLNIQKCSWLKNITFLKNDN